MEAFSRSIADELLSLGFHLVPVNASWTAYSLSTFAIIAFTFILEYTL